MIADFNRMRISAEVAKWMETMIQENARFSQVSLMTLVDRDLTKTEQKTVFSRMMAAIFNSARGLSGRGDSEAVQANSTTEPLQLGTVHVECSRLLDPRGVEALCSGIVVSQTTTKLSMQLGMHSHDGRDTERGDDTSALLWKWLAYALFSKRAMEFSAVASAALLSISSMSVADMEAFKAVLESDHPEEELFGCPRGQVEARDAIVKAGASLYWELTNRRQLLREWNRLQWPDRRLLSTSRVQVLQYALYNPIWWSKCQDFQVATSVPLGAGSVKFRNLCRALAKANKHCLADFLDNDRHWLTSGEFFEMVCSIVEPELGSRILLRDIFVLYYQMRSIYQRVLPHPEAGGLRRVVSSTTPPSLGVVVTASTPEGSRSRFFPGLKAGDWKKLIQPLDELEQHPMVQLGCPRGRVHQTLTQIFWLRRCLVPVVHDVLLRLFFGDLIVGSRLFFMLTSNPNAQLCVRDGCDSIETLEHCFLTCPALTQMWQILWSQWRRAFRSTLEWKLLLFPSNRDVARGWRDDQENLLLLWKIHTAIVFHATWRLRNDIYFGETQAVTPNIANLQASFRSHCHFLFRHSSDWNIDGGALNRVLTRLGFVSEQTELLPNLPRQRIWTPRC